ncbi:MAG: ATP-binding cassette domain-containing protein, partial [Rhodocyclaceae bacterium]|nr:ATP-binding cassette domain-containing protein [Rhodocyclaceae bacterium]
MKPALKCQDLCKSFGSTVALLGLNITIDPGECVAILGPNGSGKTTLIRLILGLMTPTSGTLSVLDGTPGSVAVKQSIGAMLQDAALPDQLTVVELV